MSHPEYQLIGACEDVLMEECGELIQAICKAKRFGWRNWHPVTKQTNVDRVLAEIADVEDACARLKHLLIEAVQVKP